MITMRGTVTMPDGTVQHDRDVLLLTVEDAQGLIGIIQSGQEVSRAAGSYIEAVDKKISLIAEYVDLLERRIATLEKL